MKLQKCVGIVCHAKAEAKLMVQAWMKYPLAALAMLMSLAAAGPAAASSAHPTLAEVNAVVDVLRFRGMMRTDPAKAIATYSADYGRTSLVALDGQMNSAGINMGAGWRYLLSSSVFTATAVAQKKSLIVYYNPWTDSALFTVWQPVGKYRRIVDAAWVPGDMVRKPHAEINPMPLWLRGTGYRPDTLAQSVVVTVNAIETRFGDPGNVLAWRRTLGIQDAATYNRLVPPMLALTLDESLLRVKALAVPGKGEDPRLTPLRAAAFRIMRTAHSKGFAPLLAEAKDTTAPMKALLSRINPQTMIGLAPVAFVAGPHHVTMFFVSMASADFMISARFVEKGRAYAVAQFEFIPYAAVYKVATTKGGAQ